MTIVDEMMDEPEVMTKNIEMPSPEVASIKSPLRFTQSKLFSEEI